MNLDYPKLTSVIVKAMQELINTLDERISNVLASITELVADKIKARQEICIDDVCINKDQLRSLLENTNNASVSESDSAVLASGEEAVQNTTPPTITITGNNPAVVEINSNYIDLGATAVDNQGNSLIVDTIDADTIDTTTVGEYTVTYTAFDGTFTSTTTRRVIVEELIVASPESIEQATTTEPTTTKTIVDSL
ncbi:hypothetical protein A2996_00150 [Candidatus Campbellbacteria bacterium RIFCSPLOWO2_01_FULL_34_15]|uniref:Pesticidal crystal protein Cry22Aa Ig-like domain-containing protein n=1 Tax=Candidatus Campbellbacteria bacterium RIFCSPLOWO2_01_FULL_34_15 TaxID=1797579 RepID=A0A1F5ENG4_9BACT|nr:MAG: hypothetical protein A2996_00150 [Candidatus Campbellbacteria bacterium RIFCSPLOWO2_01_FULL_34_15]